MIREQFGGVYAKNYDAIYTDLPYEKSVRFVEQVFFMCGKNIKDILSLGPGTCTPDIMLAKSGYRIHGVDKSVEMIELALAKIKSEGLTDKISLEVGDAAYLKGDIYYDAAYALFNVAGYWSTNEQVNLVFGGVSESLKKGGLFIFDAWYGPAVLTDRPGDRVKEIDLGNGRRVIRTTKTTLNLLDNTMDINFHLIDIRGDYLIAETKETHTARYWFLPELDYFLSQNGMELINASSLMDLNNPPSDESWDLWIVARKK